MSKVFDENLSCPDDVQSSLRDRIAAVIDQHTYGFPHQSYELADAVIEALNLKIAVDYMSVDGQHRNFMLAGNYTTEKQ